MLPVSTNGMRMRGLLRRIGFVFAAVLVLLLTFRCSLVKPHPRAPEPPEAATQQSAQQPPSAAAPAPQAPVPAPDAQAAAPPVEIEPTVPPQGEPAAAPAPGVRAAAPQAGAEPAPTPSQPVTPAAPVAKGKAALPPQPAVKPAAPTQPASGATSAASGDAAPKSTAPVSKTPAPAPLDLDRLKQQLKDTKAIGFFSKLTLKNQMDDLLSALRKFHQGQGKLTLTDLHRSYDLLVMKVLSLVQDDDRKLASDIVSSREAIWRILADPKKFGALQL